MGKSWALASNILTCLMPIEVPDSCMVSKDLQVNDPCGGGPTTAELTIKSQQGYKLILWNAAYFLYCEKVSSGTFLGTIQYAKSAYTLAACDVKAQNKSNIAALVGK